MFPTGVGTQNARSMTRWPSNETGSGGPITFVNWEQASCKLVK